MRRKYIITLSVLAALMMSGLYDTNIITADGFSDELKQGLLVEKNIDFRAHNTNNDNSVNVLDLCRIKHKLLYGDNVIAADPVNLRMQYPVIDYNTGTVSIPVEINNTSYDISAVQFSVEFDNSRFVIGNVRPGSFGGNCSYSARKRTVQMSFDHSDRTRGYGILFYIDLNIKSDLNSGIYSFSLKDEQISAGTDPASMHRLEPAEFHNDQPNMYVYLNYYAPKDTVPVTVTTVPETTTTVPVTTTVPEATTTVTTTVPKTTVITTTTVPVTTTVTTTTTVPVTTTVTTTTTMPVTTTVTTTTTRPVTTTTYREQYNISSEGKWFFDQINQLRVQNGFTEYKISDRYFEAADERAKELSRTYSYYLPDGQSTYFYLEKFKLYPTMLAEYMSKSSSVEEVYNEFLSEWRSAVLTQRNYNSVALGHYNSGGRDYWYVLLVSSKL